MTPWRAQKGPQLTAIRNDLVDELLYGGAVFGGKSDFLLGDFAQDVPGPYGQYWHGILFRKTYKQLEELIKRSKEIYPGWFPGVKWCKSGEDEKSWVWPNGARLKMRHLDSDDDWENYWGHAFTWIGWDELGLWGSPIPYKMMKARLRCAQRAIPNMRIRASANPGGAGHHWVKAHFGLDRYPNGGVTFDAPDGSGMRRLFVKSRLSDNTIGARNDPGYAGRLEGTGSPELVRALKEGDWSVIAGSFFSEFSIDRHVIRPFTLPSHWPRFRAMDWGSAAPFSVGWYAVSGGEVPGIARGALIKYREWYGIRTNDKTGEYEPNVGVKMDAEAVAAGIKKREEPNEVQYGVIDPSALATNGGPSIGSRMALAPNFIVWRAADNKRVPERGAMGGWDQLRARLRGDADGNAMLLLFDTCIHTIRTLPALQHDPIRAEDVDSDGEDHAGDETRYACMSRPYMAPVPKDKEPPRGALSIQEMTDRYEASRENTRRI